MVRRAPPRGWMPIWPAEVLAVLCSLPADAGGAYARLQCHYWIRPGPFPDSDEKLALLAGAPSGQMWARWRDLLSPHFVVEAGLWRHEHLDRELARFAYARKQKQRAALARWRKS